MGRWEKRGSSWREGVREGYICTWEHGLGRSLGFPELQRFPHKIEISCVVVAQLLSPVQLFATPWTAARHAFLHYILEVA